MQFNTDYMTTCLRLEIQDLHFIFLLFFPLKTCKWGRNFVSLQKIGHQGNMKVNFHREHLHYLHKG